VSGPDRPSGSTVGKDNEMTRLPRLLLAVLAGLALTGTTATVAHAEDGFRFWGYYQWTDGKWAFASKGPDGIVPADGAVEGWRFAVGGKAPRTPRAAGDFQAVCGSVPAETGKKRVAVIVDPGTPEDAPPAGGTPTAAKGTCVVTDSRSTGANALAAVAQVRIEKSLTCGIDGYPAKGCGDPVKNIQVPAADTPVTLEIGPPSGAAPAADDDSQAWLPVAGIAVLVALVGGGAFMVNRRRRGTGQS
jgi:hypothetical protein